MLIFHKEPALWLALVAAVVSLGSNFAFHWTSDQQGVVNALALAVVGLITAWSVNHGALAAAILGVVGAVLSLALAFGAHLDATSQATIMSFAAAVVAMFVRTQVVTRSDVALAA